MDHPKDWREGCCSLQGAALWAECRTGTPTGRPAFPTPGEGPRSAGLVAFRGTRKPRYRVLPASYAARGCNRRGARGAALIPSKNNV